jgi:hypothetical protein
MNLEAKNVDVAFQDLDAVEQVPVVNQFFKCHMIHVAVGHMTEAPYAITYASVVSREYIRIVLLTAALNGLEVFEADIQNAYLTSPCKEYIYSILGEEIGPHMKGRKAIVVRALYGLKSAGALYRNNLVSCLGLLCFTSSTGNPDDWF